MVKSALDILLLILSVALLWRGAEWLIEGASVIGKTLGLSDLTIGLTIVAFGTSAPEFAVTVAAAFQGHADISVGNIVGSNIFNLGFILGGCALFGTLKTSREVVYRDGLLLILTASLLIFFFRDRFLARWEAGILLLGLVSYLFLLWRGRDRKYKAVGNDKAGIRDGAKLLIGIACVVGGGDLLVDSASSIARVLGISEWVIAVTIVAAGTSAPELATSLMAAVKGKSSISLGNLIGSDLFNLLGVLGTAGLIKPMGVVREAGSSMWMLLAMCVMAVAFMRTGWRLTRMEGLLLVLAGAIRWTLDIFSW
ncbi:MAG: sodium:calcium antiporter [Deltaproteobacteria bacterium]|nr:sodium:calcium antiporter [Deltaproteobacteria bacterium]